MAFGEGKAEHLENDLAPATTAEDQTVLADNVAYGPGGIKGIVSSPFVFGAAFIASLGGFSFGYDQGVISIINVMPQFHDRYPEVSPSTPGSGFYKGFMTAMLELADKISRKWALSVVVCIFNLGAIIQTAPPDYGTLVAGRTIGGIGVGTLALGAPLYISEISPPNLRGALLVLESVSIVSGVVVAYWITYGTRYMDGEIAFRLPFGLQVVAVTALGGAIHLFPYSPRWLSLVNRNDDALQALAKLRRLPPTDERVQTEWKGIMAEVEFQNVVQERTHPGKRGFKLEVLQWTDLFKKKTLRRTAVGMGVAFFQQFSGINAFIYYAPSLFETLGAGYEMSLILSGALNILQLVAVVICFFVIDHVGRRPLAFWGAVGMFLVYVTIAALVGVYAPSWNNAAAGWATVSMAFVYMLVYGVSYSPLGWALPSEVFSTATRAKGVALSTATVWISNFIIGVIVPPMLESAGYGTYIFFAAFCGLAAVWAWFLVPETKGKTLEEMDDVFGDTSGQAEKEMMKQAAANARRRSTAAMSMASQANEAREKNAV
ncbi:hypothetical protein LTR70_008739 [Exophiala xenobiotica]|uniref:Major facilitator superfamily (MFS) profile domain-containing protein n=1 Tax=Lithohypha guttulata TaxID=1690604 RepID=A0ABR0JZK0_9EURO|nr:hypothetical protein LTR24_008577 [Lithohypha guttulata]KAK5311512.1 hypothetical protein LTR70_008739 [Exophiala xenobiotica]